MKWETNEKEATLHRRSKWYAQLILDMNSSYEKVFNRYHANTYYRNQTGRQWIARVEDQMAYNDWEVLGTTNEKATPDGKLLKSYAEELEKLIQLESNRSRKALMWWTQGGL